MSKKSFWSDVALYGSIAFMQSILSTPEPITWRSVGTAIVATLLIIKAKRSKGKENHNETQESA